MKVKIPLAQMTTAEKLRALEEIRVDLQATPENVPSPAWHEDVLRAREQRVREGSSQFVDWNEAKARLRKQI